MLNFDFARSNQTFRVSERERESERDRNKKKDKGREVGKEDDSRPRMLG